MDDEKIILALRSAFLRQETGEMPLSDPGILLIKLQTSKVSFWQWLEERFFMLFAPAALMAVVLTFSMPEEPLSAEFENPYFVMDIAMTLGSEEGVEL